jgi:hypothetical protein
VLTEKGLMINEPSPMEGDMAGTAMKLVGPLAARSPGLRRPPAVRLLGVVLALRRAGFCRGRFHGVLPSHASTLRGVGRPVGRFNSELLGVLRVQPLPAAELHRLATNDAADGSSAEKAIQNIETNVPPGSTH